MSPMTSAEQAGEVSAGRHEAVFEAVFLKYYGRVVGVLAKLLGERARAEELASDVFLKLYRQPWLRDSDGNLGAWLYRASTNLGIDALRAASRRGNYEEAAARETPQAGAADPLQDVLREEQRRQVRAVLARLKSSHAQILILRASGLSYNELAEALGLARGSVGTMLARAEAEFQKRFLKMFGRGKQS